MDVLACIPELPGPAGSVATAAVSEPQRPAEVVAVQDSTPEPSGPAFDSAANESSFPAPRLGAVRRSRPTRFPFPSIIALAAVAAVLWTAAWRNDRLRLEAARQQRPERLAQELPGTGSAARSVKP